MIMHRTLHVRGKNASQKNHENASTCYIVRVQAIFAIAPEFSGGPSPGRRAHLLRAPPERRVLRDPPPDFALQKMDGGCSWAPLGDGVRSTSRLLAPYFARLNEPLLERAPQEAAGRRLVSFSHFLPRTELHRTHPSALGDRLGDVEGSHLLGEQARCSTSY